jgi:hypothetical protein
MTRGNFLLWNKLHIVLRGFVMLMIITGLVGCTSSPPTPTPPILCTPESPNVNIYRTAPQTLVEKIVQHVAQGGTESAFAQLEPQISEARFATFQYLVDQTERWSDSETIKLDVTNEAQITLTFLSPDLIQAAFLLSQILKDNFSTSDIPTQIQTVLNSIGNRDELLFLVTVTATSSAVPNSSQHIIHIPMDRMILTNTEDCLFRISMRITYSTSQSILQPIPFPGILHSRWLCSRKMDANGSSTQNTAQASLSLSLKSHWMASPPGHTHGQFLMLP